MGRLVITDLRAREVLDCRGFPTVQVDCWLDGSTMGRADVPAGRSTSGFEAVEVRDGGARFGGRGVRQAVAAVHDILAPALVGTPAEPLRLLDSRLRDLDGTPDKSRLGANAICAVSLALARACAAGHSLPLYAYLNADAHVLPVPQFNLINGGLHASGSLDFQEFIVMPVGAGSFSEALQIGSETNQALRQILAQKVGLSALNVGDEGGCTPSISDPRQALEYLHEAVDLAGYGSQIKYGLDCAGNQLFDAERRAYRVDGEYYNADGLCDLYLQLIRDFDIVSIEDPFAENDVDAFRSLTKSSGIQIVGDDLFATNVSRLEMGIASHAANALLWKVNQVGTLTEALDAATLAFSSGMNVVVSERSGETEDPIIADLSVALGASQIKTGAPVRGERTAKYNRLLLIEEELGASAAYAQPKFGKSM